jgi:acetylornithine deacetylase
LNVDDVVQLTAALARINSVNPSLVPGAPGEEPVARFVADWARERGLQVHVTDAAPGRPNVVAVRRGRGGGRSLLLNAHLDTVGAADEATMEVRVEAERVVGRGVLDTKGGLAAALVVAASFAPEELDGDVIVAAVADEEYASIGTEALVSEWAPDAAIVLEPTNLAICAGHRGFAVIHVDVTGRAAHTSRPDRGVNAVHAAANVVSAITDLDAQWAAGEADVTQRPLALVSRIDSGSETFTVPPRCSLVVEVRTTAADPEGQTQAVHRAVDGVAASVAPASLESRTAIARAPLGTAADHPLVTTLADALAASGAPVVLAAMPFWTDAALHAAAGSTAVVFGPAGEGLHEDVEWVSIPSLQVCVQTLAAAARQWCSR